jgi:DNA adenine methylase
MENILKRTPQLIKYIGNKTKFVSQIIKYFPKDYDLYVEPFFGSGAILGALKPHKAIAVDIHKPLIDMWKLVKENPKILLEFYTEKWAEYVKSDDRKKEVYKETVRNYNNNPNPLDFLFISRTCYGGVLRYRKSDGHLSTPVGVHRAIPPKEFAKRITNWNSIVKNVDFICGDFGDVSSQITKDSIVYCDPPYVDSQKILYGAQSFDINRLYRFINEIKNKNGFVALSIDGKKKSGEKNIILDYKETLFEEEVFIELGGSMLKRFQLKESDTLKHRVQDRLLLTKLIELTDEQLSLSV